jgi:hypothetical protein
MSRKIKTMNVGDVIKVTQEIGDALSNQYYALKDLKVAQGALSAYKTAISAAKTQLVYKKLTGKPGEIKFLED